MGLTIAWSIVFMNIGNIEWCAKYHWCLRYKFLERKRKHPPVYYPYFLNFLHHRHVSYTAFWDIYMILNLSTSVISGNLDIKYSQGSHLCKYPPIWLPKVQSEYPGCTVVLEILVVICSNWFVALITLLGNYRKIEFSFYFSLCRLLGDCICCNVTE